MKAMHSTWKVDEKPLQQKVQGNKVQDVVANA
jgi:hypothetical protein